MSWLAPCGKWIYHMWITCQCTRSSLKWPNSNIVHGVMVVLSSVNKGCWRVVHRFYIVGITCPSIIPSFFLYTVNNLMNLVSMMTAMRSVMTTNDVRQKPLGSYCECSGNVPHTHFHELSEIVCIPLTIVHTPIHQRAFVRKLRMPLFDTPLPGITTYLLDATPIGSCYRPGARIRLVCP